MKHYMAVWSDIDINITVNLLDLNLADTKTRLTVPASREITPSQMSNDLSLSHRK